MSAVNSTLMILGNRSIIKPLTTSPSLVGESFLSVLTTYSRSWMVAMMAA